MFIEVYNPWAGGDRPPAELYYDYGNGAWNTVPGSVFGGVRLNQVTPLGNSPVWRMLVIRGNTKDRDPDNPVSGQRPNANHIERGIYFADPTALAGGGHGRERFFTDQAIDGAMSSTRSDDGQVLPGDLSDRRRAHAAPGSAASFAGPLRKSRDAHGRFRLHG